MTDRLELTWPNKDRFLLSPRDADGKPVWVDRNHPGAVEVRGHEFTGKYGEVRDDQYADNLLITGDSHDALRMLCEVPEFRRQYRGKVKLVYIDPPFNTGQTFANYDDWLDHSTWLSMMRDRLLRLRDLMSPEGMIWLHLDDVEQHRARLLLDEVFGPQNFVATVIWQKVYSPRMDAKQFSTSHDYIMVYSKNPGVQVTALTVEPNIKQFRHTARDGRRYRSDALRKTGTNSRREDRPNLWYSIAAPDGTEVWPVKPDGTEGNWRWSRETYEKRKHELDWLDKGSGLQPYVRQYADVSDSRPPESLWLHEDVGHTHEASGEVKRLLGVKFATPKPERLLERIMLLATNPGDIVVDCFAGSGTTAAVATKMGRRWITVELSKETVAGFTLPRLERILTDEEARLGAVSGSPVGFRTVDVQPSLYAVASGDAVVLTVQPDDPVVARAVAGQLGFEAAADPPFVGRRGRMRLAYVPGAIGPQDVVELAGALGNDERLTVVAMVVLEGTEQALAEASPGSRVLKLPRDVLAAKRRWGDDR